MAADPPLSHRLAARLRELGVEEGAQLLVAVSGGADSMVLLHLLRFGVPGLGLTLSAAHFDHAMRPGSAADAAWVAGACRAWGVRLLGGRATGTLRGEAEARRARYAFLQEARAERGADWVLTAHHADDQAETVLFRAVRGSGPAGLAGIAPRDPERRLLRPLLEEPRAALRRYARAQGVRWREDPSNADLHPARNRIRRQLLPALEELAPGAGGALARLAALARADEAAWSALLRREMEGLVEEREGALILVRDRLRGYDSALAARLLRGLLRRFGVVPDRDATRRALRFIDQAPSGRVLQLAGGVRLSTEFGAARIERGAPPPSADVPLQLAGSRGEGRFRLGGVAGRLRWRPADPAAPPRGPLAVSLALAPAHFPLLLRGRLPGDRVRTPAGTRSLKRLLNDRRVPLSLRARVPVLADAEGRVLWVAGHVQGAPAPRPGEPGVTFEIDDA